MKKIHIGLVFFLYASSLYPQACPTNSDITSDCTFASGWTVSGTTRTISPGVIVTVTGNLTLQSSRTLIATGATINISGSFSDGFGTNVLTGGNITANGFSLGGGGDFTLSGATITLSSDAVSISGDDIVLSNSTFTGVSSWSTNSNTYSMTNVNITSTGNVQFEDATITGGTFNVGGQFSTTNGTNTMTGSTVSSATMSLKNLAISDGTFSSTGNVVIESGNVSMNNTDFDAGTSNATTGVSTISMNGGGVLTLTNGSTLDVTGDWSNNEVYIDDSDVTISGDFDNAGAEILDIYNGGTITIGDDFNNSGSGSVSAESGGVVNVGGDFNNTGGGSVFVDGGGIVVGGTFSGNTPTGDTGTDCTSGGGACCGDICGTLPVELSTFKAIASNGQIEFNWITLSETNNQYFTLWYSVDGISFKSIAEISGSGTIASPVTYQYTWQTSLQGLVYVKISQTDYDGTIEFFPTKVVSIGNFTFSNPILSPSISNGKEPLFLSGLTQEEPIIYSVFNQEGKEMGKVSTENNTEHQIVLPIEQLYLHSGTYFITINHQVFRFIINQ